MHAHQQNDPIMNMVCRTDNFVLITHVHAHTHTHMLIMIIGNSIALFNCGYACCFILTVIVYCMHACMHMFFMCMCVGVLENVLWDISL